MGAGKSSVGRCLARLTGLPRFDTDEMIAKDFGMPVARIFAQHGEEAFRDAETEMLRRLRREADSIIVTGGGIVLRPENAALLKEIGMVVHLNADEETLFRRLTRQPTRPLIQTENPRATMKKLLEERAPLYHSTADIAFVTSQLSPQEMATKILHKMEIWRSRTK
jgi:shikimate kinase